MHIPGAVVVVDMAFGGYFSGRVFLRGPSSNRKLGSMNARYGTPCGDW